MSEAKLSGWERVLDRSVILCFDRHGFERHRRRFDDRDLAVDLRGRVALVTGASAGLGLATARGLAGLGATTYLLVRDLDRGEAARRAVLQAVPSAEVRVAHLDLARLSSVADFVERFTEPQVDILVHNAGVLPDARAVTEDGLELTWATNVAAPFALTARLLPRLLASPDARVVNVSSGGMLTQRLDLELVGFEGRPFDGVVAYAQTKRAEVVLAELWAERLRGTRVTVSAMHPGWADTPGVARSLPRFYRLTRRILRTPEQGADTIVWLAASARAAGVSGTFWFDRAPAAVHLGARTHERPGDRERLWAQVAAQVRRVCPEPFAFGTKIGVAEERPTSNTGGGANA